MRTVKKKKMIQKNQSGSFVEKRLLGEQKQKQVTGEEMGVALTTEVMATMVGSGWILWAPVR